ncbi:Transcriptional regulator-like protein [Hapsidospora chrysogenum ATCC 11550]|uniref:Transcriptional regulator-like protein n=2 Tax=Hapsidospora chrysogena TaxID=5044 RepID=A0A086TBT1_HAPC1|nr:Transcriptional regulator-like protein [Hapsidospora chrysogenum ATCC 11550]QJF53820.1 26S proteasome regulatory subunit-like protein [Hapsidospora chrysogena]
MISVSHPPYLRQDPHNNQDQQQNANGRPAYPSQHSLSSSQSSHYPTTAPSFDLDHINSLATGALPNAPMQADAWGNLAQYQPDQLGRLPHQRESSLSSMGSTGPASPYNQNISNPQIAITDSTGEELSDMHAQDVGSQNSSFYQLAKSAGNPYSGYQNFDQTVPEMAYPVTIQGPRSKPRTDRGLLPAAELAGSSNRSHPASVASSLTGDSPATPSAGGENDAAEKRRKGRHPFARTEAASESSLFPRLEGYGNVPKLDRTLTDAYGDELYSPNFTITSTPPSRPQQPSTASPPNDIFSQRLNAANSQHLSIGNSPASRDRSSPFRALSPFANSANHDFATSQGATLNSAQRMREQSKAQQDAQMFRQRVAPGTEPETPKTISPKDAILEFNEPEETADFPLFPPHSANFNMDQLAKMMPPQGHHQPFMADGGNGGQGDRFNYLPSHMPTGIQVPQQYPFVARMQPNSDPSPPRLSTSGSSPASGGSTPAYLARPPGTAADGGTYTCTYHGCTLRFETPALLQKHKREGHRQSHGLAAPRPHETGMTSSLVNSQAGPHRCDRINPSTGKPCQTVFSRPYDLTRHEDTIHNARKQKVRCDLCTEEKTFSRADALTRHYRVCHPDMELPGKLRRRGGG